MYSSKIINTLVLLAIHLCVYGQEVPILNYSTSASGQVQLEVASSASNYYLLNIRHSPTGDFELATSMTIGEEGTTIISEPLQAYPETHYQVLEHPINDPVDTDGDGEDDVKEFNDLPSSSPINYAAPVAFNNGAVAVDQLETFEDLSVDNEEIPWAPFLDDQEFAKFVLIDFETDQPKLYFVNTNTHPTHQSFGDAINDDVWANNVVKGEIVYYPTIVNSNGAIGVFAWNYTFGDILGFEVTRKTHELIAANMPFLKNNLSFFVTTVNESIFNTVQSQYAASRIPILYESQLFADVDYLPLHVAEGFGLFRLMDLSETPGAKDVVLYESIPNTLPRVGGIMTSFIQTPLSHVNLRAIQDDIPNAFIRDPLQIDSIANLIGKYVYYKVEQSEYFIREATLDEVNDWFEEIRPDKEQTPALNLSYTSILPLEEINFDMSDGFGAKCANVATMRTFGFPDGTIPNGFGIPFYFYQEFMKYNNFFAEAEAMIADPGFQTDINVRSDILKEFRSKIKAAEMPSWMMDELQTMHESFPEGTAVRCRSSTNNEDLPGFSGAGLYTSKTQHLDEGHISKSIKQVFASMWNFRAFDEREFYRIDHFVASMGVLCHPNYTDEKANGVGVSLDPFYQTDNTFYLNTQVGEDLVTNPNVFSIPEEILLDRVPSGGDGYVVIRPSNLVPSNQLVMSEGHLVLIRQYLSVIHDEFAKLYDADGIDEFAMDIEYKITSTGKLVIKQARPWASYWSTLDPISTTYALPEINLKYYPNPVDDYLNLSCDCHVTNLSIFNAVGQQQMVLPVQPKNNRWQIPTGHLSPGIYVINGIDEDGEIYFAQKFVKR